MFGGLHIENQYNDLCEVPTLIVIYFFGLDHKGRLLSINNNSYLVEKKLRYFCHSLSLSDFLQRSLNLCLPGCND